MLVWVFQVHVLCDDMIPASMATLGGGFGFLALIQIISNYNVFINLRYEVLVVDIHDIEIGKLLWLTFSHM